MTALRRGPVLPCLLFLIAASVYAINLNKPPDFDELYHVLAARGYLKTGDFTIAEGFYRRTEVFTWMIAKLFDLLGDHLWVARLPSLVSVALMAALLFIWMRSRTGNLAALIATLMFALSPFAVDTAEFARFYGVHGLTFMIGCFATYAMVAEPTGPMKFFAALIIALFAFAAAMYFQVTTLIGVAGLGTWLIVYLLGPWFLRPDVALSKKLVLILTALLLVAVLLILAKYGGILGRIVVLFRTAPMWAAENSENAIYYHLWFVLFYPTFWTLLPILLFVGLVAAPRPVFFAAAIFGIGISLHSLAGSKGLRYVFYLLPFIYILWGVALAALLRRIAAFTVAHAGIVFARLRPGGDVTTFANGILVVSVIWIVAANAASVRTVTLLADITVPPAQPTPHWNVVEPILRNSLKSTDVVMTSSELDALYYLGRYDILISTSRFREDATQGMGEAQFTLRCPDRQARNFLAASCADGHRLLCHRRFGDRNLPVAQGSNDQR